MASFRIRFTSDKPATAHLVRARSLCRDSVATLRQKAESCAAIAEIAIFTDSWHENRVRLSGWLALVQKEPSVFVVSELRDEDEEFLSAERFAARLEHLRAIELETQQHIDLEEGFISSREEFEAHDDDWTTPST